MPFTTRPGSFAFIPGSYGQHSSPLALVAPAADDPTSRIVKGPEPLPKIVTLIDDFTTQDAAKWTYSAGASVSGGQLVLIPSGSYTGTVISAIRHDLTDSSFVVEVPQVATKASGAGFVETYVNFDVSTNYSNGVLWSVRDDTLYAYRDVSGSRTTVASATYSATDHRWLRIRESAGTVYWDTSPDGNAWTNLGSWAWSFPSGFTPADVRTEVGTGTQGTVTGVGNALVDNVNNVVVTRSEGDTAAATDAAAAVVDSDRAPVDTAAGVDAASPVADVAQAAADTAAASDAMLAALDAFRDADDTATVQDSAATALHYVQAPADTAGAVDSVDAQLSGGGSQTASDAAAALDAASFAADNDRADGDTAAATDSANAALSTHYALEVSDVAAASDVIALAVAVNAVFADTAGAVDEATFDDGTPPPHVEVFAELVPAGGTATLAVVDSGTAVLTLADSGLGAAPLGTSPLGGITVSPVAATLTGAISTAVLSDIGVGTAVLTAEPGMTATLIDATGYATLQLT